MWEPRRLPYPVTLTLPGAELLAAINDCTQGRDGLDFADA